MSGLVSAGASELAAKLNDFVTENRLPGATAAVVQGDELAWIAGTGFADQDTRQPSQPDTLYRIASITKTFTGTAVMQLRDAGRLDLDDPAVAYLPERATGYDWRTVSDQLDPAPAMSPVWAEGGLWSCAEDMARWLSFQLRAYRQLSADSPVLSAASLREMHKPRYLADDDWTSAWGISWCANRHDHVTWIQHSGGLPGFTSTVCFDPREQVGAIVLINGTSRNVELAPELASVARRLAPSAPPATQTPTPMPEQYRPLLGIYAGSGLAAGVLRLEWCDGKLAFVNQEPALFRLALEPTSNPDSFVAERGSYFSGENVTFHRRADGRVISVLLIASTFMRLDQVPPSQ
jgi:CubicO group peptidase (beta-lactamase class C family)